MSMDAAFSTEFKRLEASPASPAERVAAQRALVRYEKSGGGDEDSQVSASEDWVRLFIALRRVHPPRTRITPELLKQWKTKITSSTIVKRKCFLVETAALDALPTYPPDLDKWVIPKDELELPADIYTDGMLIIDDGYDRAKLNVPRVLHIECAARWSRQRPTPPSYGRSCGSTFTNDEYVSEQEAPLPLPSIEQEAASAPLPLPSTEHQEQGSTAVEPCQSTAADPFLEHDADHAMQEIIANAMTAVRAQRWMSVDQSQPNTLEFWLRIFRGHMEHCAKTPSQWTETQKAFVKYITRECLQSTSGAALDGIVPHLQALGDMAPDHMPSLARSICKLRSVDFTAACWAETSERAFHEWLQEHVPLAQVQFLYSSPLYQAFLKIRFTKKLDLAKKSPADRGETIRVLLESTSPGSAEHAALVFTQIMDDEAKPVLERLRLLWCTPKADELLAEWNLKTRWGKYLVLHEEACRNTWEGLDLKALKETFTSLHDANAAVKDIPNVIMQSLYDEFLKIHKTQCVALSLCFDEQVQHRILRAGAALAAEEEAPPLMAEVDLSDAEVLAVAKEMHKTWSAAVGKKQACPCLIALGVELTRLQDEKKKAKEDKNKAKEEKDKEKEGEKDKEKEGETGKGHEGEERQEGEQGKGHEGEERQEGEQGRGQAGTDQTAAAPAAEAGAKVDKDGRPVAVGDIVMCYASKKKDMYNERKAQVDRLNSKQALLTMLEGPAKGNKRKADYDTFKVWEQPVKKLFAPAASSASSSASVALAASTLKPDDNCLAMFGDLHMMG